MVAGVAGGIAKYLDIDPALVRLAFVALAFTGVGVLAYPLLWLVMPLEGNARVSFEGTLDEIREQAARVSDEVREVFVGGQGDGEPQAPVSVRAPRFDPLTGEPLSPEASVGAANSRKQMPTSISRMRLLGYVLLALGGFLLLNIVLPGAERFIFPVVLIAVGFLLLRRRAR
jgi:phage shock protein C